jgi:hypothetical protein
MSIVGVTLDYGPFGEVETALSLGQPIPKDGLKQSFICCFF